MQVSVYRVRLQIEAYKMLRWRHIFAVIFLNDWNPSETFRISVFDSKFGKRHRTIGR